MLPPRHSQAETGRNRTVAAPAGARDELLSEVAHAFRTPLGVITGYVELLELRDDPALRAEALARIEAATRRLGQAIDRLVTVLESDSGDVAQRFLEPDRAPEHDRDGAVLPGVPEAHRSPNGRGTTRVVIVDDDDEIRELLLRTLPTDGFEILEARDGREALALIEREAPDLLVLDWNMPHATGGEVLAELTRQERRVPVIVLTAEDDPRRRHLAETHGADVFLAKPFSPLELLREIERLLARSPRERFGD